MKLDPELLQVAGRLLNYLKLQREKWRIYD